MENNIILFTDPSCTSCKKAKAWLNQKEVQYQERHIIKKPPKPHELLEFLKKLNGVEDIVTKKTQMFFNNLGVDMEEIKLSEFLEYLSKEPKLLKKPIVVNGNDLVIGYKKAELERIFA